MQIGGGYHMGYTEMKLEELIAYGSKEAIIENLKDAGCSQETIDCCLACLDSGQKQIDCLDYLVFQIGRCSFQSTLPLLA